MSVLNSPIETTNIFRDWRLATNAILSYLDTSILFIDKTNSRIGIRTQTPDYDFDINGDINFSGDIYKNGIPLQYSSVYMKGNNGDVGDVSSKENLFRVNSKTLNVDVTIDADENASTSGPITIASGKTLTVNGNLVIL